jgi:glycine/sarcosine/betaine reductase complex component C subunit beta
MTSKQLSKTTVIPVVKGASYFLAHVPSMVRHGSKPSRDLKKDPSLLAKTLRHLRTFEQAVAYTPNQVFIGNIDPDDLLSMKSPFWSNLMPNASRWGSFGEIMPEEEFYGILKISDEFNLFSFEESFTREMTVKLKNHPLFDAKDIEKLGQGVPLAKIEKQISDGKTIPLFIQKDRLIGCIQAASEHAEEDSSLVPDILIENLAARASGAMALRHLIAKTGKAEAVDYLLGYGEEAVGDRYQRGGGNMAKAIGQLGRCNNATGSDIKAFCCAPVHALIIAAGLVSSGVFKNVILVGGGSFTKLGMKFEGHLRHDMPILEDVLGAIAIWVGQDDGESPVIRLDSIGKHDISSSSAQQAILEKLVAGPLEKLGMKITEVDKYATELHNPEVTEPQGSGNVPKTNYRTIGSLAVLRNEIDREELDRFVEVHGMIGFSPTQGHIASAVPYLGHAVKNIMAGKIKNSLFLAKGSLFLGRMTQLSDGISFLLEKNTGGDR